MHRAPEKAKVEHERHALDVTVEIVRYQTCGFRNTVVIEKMHKYTHIGAMHNTLCYRLLLSCLNESKQNECYETVALSSGLEKIVMARYLELP